MVISFKPSEWLQLSSTLTSRQATMVRAEVMRLTGVAIENDEDVQQFSGRFTVEVADE